MPRLPRAEYEPGVYHVSARGNRKQDIFVDDRDRARYHAMLGRAVRRCDWFCLAYCQMGNHVHLLIETTTPNLGVGMHWLQGGYAQYFNYRHGLSGHLFQDRFHAEPVRTDAHVWMAAVYIANNPLNAGLCRAASDWPWSSYAAIRRRAAPAWLAVDRLASYFGAAGGHGLRRFIDLVELKGDSPLYGPEDSERRSGRRNQIEASRRPIRPGAAQTIQES